MSFVTLVDTTYGDLKHGEVIRDKSGNSWVVHKPTTEGGSTTFSLAEPDTPTIPKHVDLTKPADAEVRVSRKPSQADEVEAREREVDEATGTTPAPEEVPTVEETVEVLKEEVGAEVIAEQTAAEKEVLDAAEVSDLPAELPRFSEFTDLEARSHLYLVHGIYAHDVKTKKALTALHDEHHADEAAKFVPHVHGDFPVPTEPSDGPR
jgi:hypothetical protein